MEDASGRYAAGYFDGNNYWMGSLTLCRNIFIEDIDRHIELGKSTFDCDIIQPQPQLNSSDPGSCASSAEHKQLIKKTGLLDDDGYDQNLKALDQSYFENPTFRPGFFIIKTVLRDTIISQNVSVAWKGCARMVDLCPL